MAELQTSCCGASDRSISDKGPSYEDIGICPVCKDHAEFIDIDEIAELTYPEPQREFSGKQQAIIAALSADADMEGV